MRRTTTTIAAAVLAVSAAIGCQTPAAAQPTPNVAHAAPAHLDNKSWANTGTDAR